MAGHHGGVGGGARPAAAARIAAAVWGRAPVSCGARPDRWAPLLARDPALGPALVPRQGYERQHQAPGGMSAELAELARLHAAGHLSDDEYAAAKARVIGGSRG